MRNIYELQNQWLQLQEMLEGGLVEVDVLTDTIEALEGEIEVKAEHYAFIIKNLSAQAQGLATEAQRLADRKQSIEKNIANLEVNLSNALLVANKTKFKTDYFDFSFRKSESVDVQDITLLDPKFITTKTTQAADKTEIKKAIKLGEVVTGASLVEKQNLQIK